MRTSLRSWLASVGVALGTGLTAHAQTPIDVPMAVPMKLPDLVAPPVKGVEGGPLKPLVPPMPEELRPPTNALFPTGTCSTCGDVNPACADPGCAGALTKGPKDPVWMNNGAMLLWFQPQRVSFPLATGNAVGQSTQVLLSGRDELGQFIALKLDGGLWLNKEHTVGAGLDGFITEHRSSIRSFSGGPDGLSIQRPFVDAAAGVPASLLVASATAGGLPAFTGSVGSTVSARLASFGGHLRRNVVYNDHLQLDFMYGFRYYDLDELLQVDQSTTLPADITRNGAVVYPAGSTVQLQDRAYTRNQFYGGEIGARLEGRQGIAFVALTPKLAFGEMHQTTRISGQTTTNGDNPQPGGLLAAGANGDGNLGRFIENRFTVATEVTTEVGVNITKNTRIAAGYQFYYLANVTRPGQQLDPMINTRVVPVSPSFGSLSGPRGPNVTVDREGFYAHGVSLLLEARY